MDDIFCARKMSLLFKELGQRKFAKMGKGRKVFFDARKGILRRGGGEWLKERGRRRIKVLNEGKLNIKKGGRVLILFCLTI